MKPKIKKLLSKKEKRVSKKAVVHIYTGEGAGKTTSVFGVALRNAGHRRKAIIIQFMKGRKDIGEYKIQNKLKPYYEVHQFGSSKFVDTKKPARTDRSHCHEGLAFAFKVIKKKPDLLILDELGLAASLGLVSTADVLKLIESTHPKTAIYITGRKNPRALLKRADFVTSLRTLKQPRKPEYIKGIEY